MGQYHSVRPQSTGLKTTDRTLTFRESAAVLFDALSRSAVRTDPGPPRDAGDDGSACSGGSSRPGARNGPESNGHGSDIPEPTPTGILRASSALHDNMAGRQY